MKLHLEKVQKIPVTLILHASYSQTAVTSVGNRVMAGAIPAGGSNLSLRSTKVVRFPHKETGVGASPTAGTNSMRR